MTYPAPAFPNSSSRRHWIPWGHFGIELTVWHMRALVRTSLSRPLLADRAASIVAGSESALEAGTRIREFLETEVVYVPDPLGMELLKSPVYMLREIDADGRATGDCDDVAILGAALGLAAGLPARFVLLAFRPGAPYEHVYTELLTDEGWLELDTTKPHQLPSGVRVVRTGHREV